jgi:hypothetical protein
VLLLVYVEPASNPNFKDTPSENSGSSENEIECLELSIRSYVYGCRGFDKNCFVAFFSTMQPFGRTATLVARYVT